MEIDAEQLIVLVEERPPIYNFTLKEHHNKDHIEQLWEEIATAIGGVTSADCKAKWNILRGSYSRHLRETRRKRHLPSGSAAQKKKTWYLANVMAFLGDFIGQHRKSKSRAMIQFDVGDGNESEMTEEEINDSIEENATSPVISPYHPADSPILPVQFQGNQTNKKRKMTAAEIVAEPMVQLCYSRCQTEKPYPPNANKQFLESMLPDLEKLSPKRQREFKYKVLGLMNSLVDDQENEAMMISNPNSVTSRESSH